AAADAPMSAATPPARAVRMATFGLIVAVTVTGAVIVSRSAGVARVTVLDVGQGDAILVEGSRGGRLLVDGGPDPDRLLVELDKRIPPWDRRIDVLILSHPHEDHVAGLALLLDRYAVGRVFEPGMRGPGPGYAAWLERVGAAGRHPRFSIGAGDRLAVDEIGLRVLWPIRGQVPTEPPDTGTGINNVSVVLLGTVGPHRFLLAGDVEEAIDPSLIAERLPTVDLLKVAHHGSRTATTQAFVSTVRPRVAVASAGTGNPYGHPARSTLERLAAAGARVYRTDQDGTVSVTFDAAGLAVRTAPRRRQALAPTVATVGVRRAFLCDVPVQPFVRATATGRPPVASGAPTALGYHRADDPPTIPGRCPAVAATDERRRSPA
ncbi:MAG TPA: ComEC/Rec2 family competence protein, partial [Candidatus Limnocylindrales bacterium]|nr:ComEC/Rec2 family competence protein [Candidatus Limnocylindrales bacterium]